MPRPDRRADEIGVGCVAFLPGSIDRFDAGQAEAHLNSLLGSGNWLLLSDWFFSESPALGALPVLCPADQAERLQTAANTRLAFSHWPSRAEVGGWRMIAAMIYPWAKPLGSFPWEIATCLRQH